MKKYILDHKVRFIFLVVVLAAVLCWAVYRVNLQLMSIAIDREQVDRVTVYCRGLSPVTLQYSEHEDALDSVFDMLSGSYRYAGIWRRPETLGGGPYAFDLYDENGELIDTILYLDGKIVLDTRLMDIYHTYVHNDREDFLLDFTEFYTYLDTVKP